MGHVAVETLTDQVRAAPGGEHLERCYACGTCVSKCLIQQRGEPTYNPRRLIRKVLMDVELEAFEDRTTWLCSACDLCYPACPQQIHISGIIQAIRRLAIQAGYDTPLQTAVVNEQTCVACGLCVEVCPYQAVTLEAQTGGRERTVARIDPGHCMACGLCAASCRSNAIELLDEFSSEGLMGELWDWMRSPIVEIPE